MLFFFLQIGMGGAYHTWSPMFPDEGGVLINICDLTLSERPLPTGFISSDIWPDPKDLKKPKPSIIDRKTRIILHTCKLPYYNFTQKKI